MDDHNRPLAGSLAIGYTSKVSLPMAMAFGSVQISADGVVTGHGFAFDLLNQGRLSTEVDTVVVCDIGDLANLVKRANGS